MKTAIKLVLIYFAILQILSPILITVPCAIYLFATTGGIDKEAADADDNDPGTDDRYSVNAFLPLESRLYQ